MHDFLEDWPEWSSKVIAYGLLEGRTRTPVRTALSGYDESEESNGMCVDVQG